MAARFRIEKEYRFSAGHHLPGLPAEHRCHRPHGHNYTVTVGLTGALVPPGFVTDFGDLAPFGEYLDATFDHRDLNESVDFEPTSELLAQYLTDWFIEHIEPTIPGLLESMTVSETPTSRATAYPERS
jgi:6-pyruvoyltetrahydropterin/6-carboxytetrahydropterin synthase